MIEHICGYACDETARGELRQTRKGFRPWSFGRRFGVEEANKAAMLVLLLVPLYEVCMVLYIHTTPTLPTQLCRTSKEIYNRHKQVDDHPPIQVAGCGMAGRKERGRLVGISAEALAYVWSRHGRNIGLILCSNAGRRYAVYVLQVCCEYSPVIPAAEQAMNRLL